MVKGASKWNDADAYYIQSNNAVERALSRYGAKDSAVTCRPSAAVNCIASMGIHVQCYTPAGWNPQPEDVLTLWFHDKRNWEKLKDIRSGTDPQRTIYSPHEVPQYYPLAVKEVFGVDAEFQWLHDFDDMADRVVSGQAVQITEKDPGHFIAVVAYDSDLDELIINDPYPVNYTDFNGFNRRLGRAEYQEHVKPYAIMYKGTI